MNSMVITTAAPPVLTLISGKGRLRWHFRQLRWSSANKIAVVFIMLVILVGAGIGCGHPTQQIPLSQDQNKKEALEQPEQPTQQIPPSQDQGKNERALIVEVERPYLHRDSGITFPQEVAHFVRQNIHGSNGPDGVGAGYELSEPWGDVVATVYVYPAGPAFPGRSTKQFNLAKWALLNKHSEAETLCTGAVLLTNLGRQVIGQRAMYRFNGPFLGVYQPVISELLVFERGTWFVKFRVSYPASLREEAQPHVDGLLENFPWTESIEAAADPPRMALVYDRSVFQYDETVVAAWMVYGGALIQWTEDNLPKDILWYGLPGHSMSQEYYSLGSMTAFWKQIKKEQDTPDNPFLDDLVLVLDAGFMREYIWESSDGIRATEKAIDLRLNEFAVWRARHLPYHSPERLAVIDVLYDNAESTEASRPSNR